MHVDSLELIEPYAHAAGRALVLAQHFEVTCKDVLMWWHVSKRADEGRIHRLSDMRSAADELIGLMLAGTIKRLADDHEISASELDTLKKAKEARNYIAHEYAAAYSFVSWRDRKPPQDDPRFRDEVQALASGDNLISSWSYMFHEKEPSPSEYMRTYPNRVAAWVFEPLEGH